VHGGAWRDEYTRVTSPYPEESRIFAELGFCVFNIDYRVLTMDTGNTDTTYRQNCINDGLAAMTWARSNAATYNGDTSKIAMIGFSAGGHLALMCAVQGTVGTTRPDAVVSWSGPTRIPTMTGGDRLSIMNNYLGCTQGDAGACDAAAITFSPYNQVSSTTCPILCVHSDDEQNLNDGVPDQQGTDMVNAAVAAGVNATMVILPGSKHADFRNEAVYRTAAWLRRTLGWRTNNVGRTAASGRVAASGRAVVP
jgi:acetyl esterase/lipase